MRLQEGRSEYMESEGAQADPMEYDSLLPPRKRLLAGLKRQNCDCSPPLPFISGELGAHFHGLLTSSDLSPEEIVEASRATALAAAKAATAARVAATEKAVAAVKAKAFARSVLELVAYASVVGDENCRKSHPRRKKRIKKKHVPVELLYEAKCPVRCSETDEELARKLHRAMNSSPRISRRLNKALGSTKKDDKGTICDGNWTSLGNDYVEQRDGNSQEKLGVGVVICSRVESPEKMVEASELSGNIQWLGKGVGHGRRGRSKQKRLPLSQCCMRAREDFGKMQRSESYHPLTGESKSDTKREMPISTGKPSDEEQVPLEGKSSWKCKKFKISQCHYEGKNLHRLCSITAATTTSALVKVD